MTEKENEGFHQYPREITLGTRLTKADVEHRKMLYKKSLDEKWYLIQKKERLMWGPCAFCRDAELEERESGIYDGCKRCKIAPTLCQNNGCEGLYHDWASESNKIKRHVLANRMVSEMEARIKDCDVILKAMATDKVDEIIDSERIN